MQNYRRTLIIVDYCLTPREIIRNAGILIENDFIVGIGAASAFVIDPQIRVCKYPGTYAMPGFIDTHIHGAGGFDSTTAKATLENFSTMSQTLATHGVTSFVPTIVSAPREQLVESVSILARLCEQEHAGANPVGIHMEGPYVALEKLGGLYTEFASPNIDMGFVNEVIREGNGKIKIWTLAPELEHSTELIECLKAHDIIPSMGHTNSNADDIFRAIDAGASRCTHLFNGMPQLHQREISLASIALTDDRIVAEMIMDGTHVNPRMIDLTYRTKGKDKIVGISDSIQGAGMADGRYNIGNSKINVKGGYSYTDEGLLAGSGLTLEMGWQRLKSYTGLSQTDAALAFTEIPAHSIGLQDRGELRPGMRADIIVYDAEKHTTKLTFVAGKIVYTTEKSYIWDN